MRNLSRILLLVAWTVLIFEIGKNLGLQLKTATVMHQVEKTFEESIAAGKAFVFQGTGIKLVSKNDRDFRIAYRVHTFIWPDDIEILPTPINKFGQYTWHSRGLLSSAPGTSGKEWKRP